MITIYAPEAQDFSTLGLGALAPYECTVEEQAGGMYELTMTHPMDAEGKWLNIGVGCIVKAPAPVRETPLVESEIVGEGEATEPVTVTRKIYKVQTNTGANLHLRQGPSTSTAILSKYRPGTEVVVLSQASGWGQVIVCSSGATGYMSMQYLVYVRDETETIEGDAPGPERVVYPVQSRMQLFRIFKVERDAAEREVRVEARHIFYDLLGNVVKNEYAPESEAADAVVEELFERALNPHDFSVHCQTARSVTGEYTRRGLVECLLDPDDGVLPQTGARLVRDNFDVWILPDATRETGVTIRHGKNLLGATLTTDWDSLVTRIIPVGQDKEGKALLLEGTTYMDSPHIGDYPVICAQAVEYDVKIGQEGIDNAAQARAKLQELAETDFSDNGVDLPTVGLDVDFVALGETEEYRAYADLEAVHLYDTVRVIAKSAGIDAAVRVTGYKWDALGRKYEAVTLGEIADLKTTVYGYELQRGSVKTIKIAPGAVGSAQLRELAVQYAHINTAAVEQLSANSITALKAYIAEIVAGSVTTDELYAGIASIALAQITTANIENANINWAQIGTLAADIATIAKAQITTANIIDAQIGWAQIETLTAQIASIAQAKIEDAEITTAQIADLEAAVAAISKAEIGQAAIGFAQIKWTDMQESIIHAGVAGELYIERLKVIQAQIVSAVMDSLILVGPDGKLYTVEIGKDGELVATFTGETDPGLAGETLPDGYHAVAEDVTAGSVSAGRLVASQATVIDLFASSIVASVLTANTAFVGRLVTPLVESDLGSLLTIQSDTGVKILVSEAIQNAQDAADQAQATANANAEDLTNFINSTTSDIENLQTQIDGSITTWFYEVAPTTTNPPANQWTTTDLKNIHLGDLYYNTVTGYCYRWQVKNNAYSWQRITDTDVTKALEDAANAQDTADSKRRIFAATPMPPYDVGDLWTQGTSGDIMRCKTAKTAQQSYSASDWVKASKYTDDTAANAAQDAADANTAAIGGLTTRVTTAETAIEQNAEQILLRATKAEVTEVKKDAMSGAVEQFYASNSPTTLTGGSWSTTPPAWTEGKYIWRRTLVTFGDGTTQYTPSANGVCITGNTGDQGPQGLQGLQGPKGEQGIQGVKGDAGSNGKTSYFHIKYSNVSNPTSSSQMTETPSTYIGTYVDFTEADSTDPSKYTWARFEGIQGVKGDQGIPGTNGTNGKTSYLHIAYANSADGHTGFSVSDSTNKLYIGQYTDFTQADSTDPDDYSWTKIKGDKGEQGASGTDGIGVESSTVYYYLSTSNTTQTGGSWATTPPAWVDGRYYWQKIQTKYTNGSTVESDPVCITGAKGSTGAAGATGATGATGTGIESITTQFYLSTSKTTQTGGSWVNSMPTWSPGKYLWTRSKIVYKNPASTAYTSPVCDSSWEAVNEVQDAVDFATPYISDTPPEDAPEAGKMWVDTGVSPEVWRRWKGADVTTEREYTETRFGCGKNLLDIAALSPSHTTGVHVDVEANTLRVYTTDTGGTWRAANSKPFWVRRGITHNISATLSAYDGGYSTIGMRRVADHTIVDGSGIEFGGQTGRKVCQFTPTEDIYVYLSAFCTNDTITSGDCTYTQIQLEIGETATAFEPYEDIPFLALDNAQGQISQVEVEVGCDVTSKNMIDINSLTTTTNTSLSVSTDQLRVYTTGDGGSWRGGSTRDFVLRKGVSYTLSAELVEYVSGDAYVAIRNASDNKIISALSLDFGTTPTTMSKTYTPDSNMTVYFTAFCSNDSVLTGDVTYRGIQLEVGDEATSYEKYKGLAGKDQICITACGKNLIDLDDLYLPNSYTDIEMVISGDSVRVYTTGDGGAWNGARTPAFWIRKGVTYTLSATLDTYVSGNARLGLRNAGTGTFLNEATVIFGSTPGTLTKTFTPESDEEVYLSALCTDGTTLTGDCTFSDIQLEIGSAATEYEPYRPMGGGTVTPTEPLYGLPGAEDTVEMSVDGDVLVTRRTGVFIADGDQYAPYASAFSTPEGVYAYTAPLTGSGAAHKENFAGMCSHFTVIPRNAVQSERVAGTVMLGIPSSVDSPHAWFFTTQATAEAFNAWLQQQDSAGTPVTIVYELAAPETEALTAISPIVPQPGQLNLTTDADALTATIHGSGWETVNDTSSIQDALANLDGDLASLINEVGLLNGEVGSIAQQIISPDGIKNIVFESSEYQAMANTVEVNANELSVTQTTVTDINGRVETIEGTVRISGSNIDIGRSDSNVQLHLDNGGWSISEGGQETIYARQNRVVAPRFQTTSLIFGALAFNSSGGHFRLMKYGG